MFSEEFVLFQVGRLKHAKSLPFQPPPKSLRMIEKINRKIHNLSSKPQEQLHKHSPARNALERRTNRVVSWDPAGGGAHQPRILPPWTRQQRVSSSSWEQLVLGRAQGPRTQEEGNVLSDSPLEVTSHLFLNS